MGYGDFKLFAALGAMVWLASAGPDYFDGIGDWRHRRHCHEAEQQTARRRLHPLWPFFWLAQVLPPCSLAMSAFWPPYCAPWVCKDAACSTYRPDRRHRQWQKHGRPNFGAGGCRHHRRRRHLPQPDLRRRAGDCTHRSSVWPASNRCAGRAQPRLHARPDFSRPLRQAALGSHCPPPDRHPDRTPSFASRSVRHPATGL